MFSLCGYHILFMNFYFKMCVSPSYFSFTIATLWSQKYPDHWWVPFPTSHWGYQQWHFHLELHHTLPIMPSIHHSGSLCVLTLDIQNHVTIWPLTLESQSHVTIWPLTLDIENHVTIWPLSLDIQNHVTIHPQAFVLMDLWVGHIQTCLSLHCRHWMFIIPLISSSSFCKCGFTFPKVWFLTFITNSLPLFWSMVSCFLRDVF
jgi:hypothetical protein